MGEARTTLEAVFAETTKDITELIGKVEAVETQIEGLLVTLPAAAEQLNAQFKPTLDEIYASIGRLREESQTLLGQHDRALQAIAKRTGDEVENRARRIAAQIHEQMGESASIAVAAALKGDVVKKPVADAVNEVLAVAKGLDAALSEFNTARAKLTTQAVNVNDALTEAAKQVSWSIWQRLGAQLGVALLAGVILLGLAKVMGFGSMSASQFAQLQANQQEVLKHVDQAAQHGGKRQ
ncbi:hypothetical protein [Burkholderia multivorans]|uniref:hypothetical protein n=1 Tax=Burkholderia multivorans TaxID=87883 RepID=UPI000D00C28D|nr:hypothetical protein [Burkholderia multivorans]PRG46674.1 hypothetical protein C6T63_28350 [Burkholderia multivorans]